MRRLSCLIALLACLVLALPAFAAPQKADAISGISSEKVLDIVKANKGKLVFINFFATWCPPCREEIPELISIRKAYPADKVVIVEMCIRDRGREHLVGVLEVPGFDVEDAELLLHEFGVRALLAVFFQNLEGLFVVALFEPRFGEQEVQPEIAGHALDGLFEQEMCIRDR